MCDNMINGARMLLECLSRLGIKDIFGYPGGYVITIYDELYSYPDINHYFCRHEQGAAHEADGYARASGKPGVCLATSGPGATNLVTGIMTAYMDSSPLIAITGQVTSSALGKDAFQESDIVGITVPITKNNYLVKDICELPRVMKEAYHIATTGRPGPVVVDVPKNVQIARIPYKDFEKLWNQKLHLPGYDPVYKGHPLQIKESVKAIKAAKKPLIIAGAGIIKSDAAKLLRQIAEKADIPVANSLLGLGSIPTSHPLCLGMIGMHGTIAANLACRDADLIIAAGMRFSDRITGNPELFAANAKVIHIDIDPAEIGKNIPVDIPIVGDLKNVLAEIDLKLDEKKHKDWTDQILEWKRAYPKAYYKKDGGRLNPQEVLEKLDDILQGDAIVVTDVGQHQMWTAQFMRFEKPGTFVSSGGSGTMGFGIPAAIGAQVGRPDKRVVAVVGDGGFQMTSQELMLLKQYNLPVKIILMNNGFLGMVRQWQELFYDKRYSFVDLSVNPEFTTLSEAYGVKGVRLASTEDLDQLPALIASEEPVVIECMVEREENVYPMIPAGASIQEMRIEKGEKIW